MSIDDSDRRVCVWESTSSLFCKPSQMMVDGVNGVPTNPYAAMPQLSGLAEVIVDSGRKATPIRLQSATSKCLKPEPEPDLKWLK